MFASLIVLPNNDTPFTAWFRTDDNDADDTTLQRDVRHLAVARARVHTSAKALLSSPSVAVAWTTTTPSSGDHDLCADACRLALALYSDAKHYRVQWARGVARTIDQRGAAVVRVCGPLEFVWCHSMFEFGRSCMERDATPLFETLASTLAECGAALHLVHVVSLLSHTAKTAAPAPPATQQHKWNVAANEALECAFGALSHARRDVLARVRPRLAIDEVSRVDGAIVSSWRRSLSTAALAQTVQLTSRVWGDDSRRRESVFLCRSLYDALHRVMCAVHMRRHVMRHLAHTTLTARARAMFRVAQLYHEARVCAPCVCVDAWYELQNGARAYAYYFLAQALVQNEHQLSATPCMAGVALACAQHAVREARLSHKAPSQLMLTLERTLEQRNTLEFGFQRVPRMQYIRIVMPDDAEAAAAAATASLQQCATPSAACRTRLVYARRRRHDNDEVSGDTIARRYNAGVVIGTAATAAAATCTREQLYVSNADADADADADDDNTIDSSTDMVYLVFDA